MMKQMRENTKVILWIVVIAFVVTIFAVWGLDLDGTGGGQTARQYNTLGEINGTPVMRNQYQMVYEQLASQMRSASPSGQLSYAQQELVHEQAWENLVSSVLTEQEIRRLGISVTDSEVESFLRTSPPPEIQQYFVDDNGNFDFAEYQAQLNNPEADWTAVEALARQRIPMIKLNYYLTSQVHVSPDEVRAIYDEENTRVTAEYVSFTISAEDISDFTPTDEDVQAHYDENSGDFLRSERAVIDYVKIPIEPTDYDLDGLMYTINTLNDQIAAGEDFAEMARTYSQAATSSVGGETGFITVAQRDSRVMTQVAIMNPGQVSQPIQTDDGIYLVKLLETKEEDGEPRFNIQELFLELSAGRETIDSLIALARDVYDVAAEKGLAKAAEKNGLTVETTPPFQRNFPIAGLGFVPSVNRFAFNNDKDATSNIISDEDNYYIVRVADRLPESVQPLDEVRSIIVERLKHERQKGMARHKADGFHRKLMTTPATFQEAANDYGYEVRRPEPFRFIDPVDAMPAQSPFAYAALHLDDDALCPPVESSGAWVVFQITSRAPFNEEEFINSAPAILERLHQEKVRAYVAYWYETLRDKADIVDNREGV